MRRPIWAGILMLTARLKDLAGGNYTQEDGSPVLGDSRVTPPGTPLWTSGALAVQ